MCRIRDGTIPAVKVYENDRTLAVMCGTPMTEGHVLVFTKRHVPSLYELSPVDCGAVLLTAKLVAVGIRRCLRPQGLNLIQPNGPAAEQRVPHFHLHALPRWTNDGRVVLGSGAAPNEAQIRELGERIRRQIPAL